MDPVLLRPPASASPYEFVSPAGGAAYEALLRDSIDRFLGEVRSGSCNFSGLHSVFFRVLHSVPDPPLEVVWFYLAVKYREGFGTGTLVLGRVSAVRDLLQLLVACSASCGGLKSVALLAPVTYELYRIVLEVDASSEALSGQDLKKVRREIYHLAEGVFSYISICTSRNDDVEDAAVGLLPCLVDLIRIWLAPRVDGADVLGKFFPLVNDEIRKALARGGFQIRYLAGVVMVEAFLLMLSLKVQKGRYLSAELRKDLKVWAVGSMTGIASREFFEVLLILLLEQHLPVASSVRNMNAADESFLLDILYDSVILVDYSFLHPKEESVEYLRRPCVAKLIVTHIAIEAARSKGDQDKVIAYVDAFSKSSLPSLMIKLVNDQIGVGKLGGADAATPQALLKCLLNLEVHGIRVPELDMWKIKDSLLSNESKAPEAVKNPQPDSEQENGDLFYFDKEGSVAEGISGDEETEMEMDGAFLSAAHAMKSTSSKGKKRKEPRGDGDKMPWKLVKYKTLDNPIKGPTTLGADGTSDGSDVDNPTSDDEMEESD